MGRLHGLFAKLKRGSSKEEEELDTSRPASIAAPTPLDSQTDPAPITKSGTAARQRPPPPFPSSSPQSLFCYCALDADTQPGTMFRLEWIANRISQPRCMASCAMFHTWGHVHLLTKHGGMASSPGIETEFKGKTKEMLLYWAPNGSICIEQQLWLLQPVTFFAYRFSAFNAEGYYSSNNTFTVVRARTLFALRTAVGTGKVHICDICASPDY